MRRRPAGWPGRLALLAAGLALPLAAGEIYVRARGLDLDVSWLFRFHPRYGWTSAEVIGVDHVDAQGFRATPVVTPKPPGVRRVVVLGDSFAFGIEQRYAKTFSGLLEEWLRAQSVEVVNLAVGGWGTAQELLVLERRGLALEPDVVVLQVFPTNDLCNNTLAMATLCSWQDAHRPYLALEDGGLRLTALHPWRTRLRNVLRLAGLLENQIVWRGLGSPGSTAEEFRRRSKSVLEANARRVGLAYEGTVYAHLGAAAQPDLVRHGWEVTEALLGEIQRRTAAAGASLVALVIPYARTLPEEWPRYREQVDVPIEPDYDTARLERLFAGLEVATISVRRRMAAEGLDAIDVFFPPRSANRHLNPQGHLRVAHWILEELERLAIADATGLPAAPAPARSLP